MTMLDIVPLRPERDCVSDTCIIARLLKETIRKTRKALIDGDFKRFDANPGDGGCQTRALFFATRTVQAEIDALYDRVSAINSAIMKFERDKKGDLLEDQFSFPVSEDGRFTFLSFILTCTKVKAKVLESGIIVTKTDIGTLGSLAKNFDKLRLNRRLFVSEMQTKLAQMSNAFMQKEAVKLADPTLSLKLLQVKMGRWEGFPEKPFGFLFYQIDTLLRRIEEEKITICVRTVKPGYTLFFDDCDDKKLVVVFEGATTQPKEELKARIDRIGFSMMIRYCAAIEKQFGPQSPFECDDEEITAMRALHLDIGDFVLDHIYTQTRERI